MLNKKNFKGINVETLVLVAIWETPFIFQGCFKITELNKEREILFFFRCKSSSISQTEILNHDFLPEQYEFTHLYNNSGLIKLNHLNSAQEDAIYLLKYALHVTIVEMLANRKLHFTSIDDIAMQALIDKVTPLLSHKLTMPEEEHIGFAVAMDYCPKDDESILAALTLLLEFKNPCMNS